MNNKHTNFTYAIRDNKLVYIDDVEKDLSCGCICPTCEGKLIARKGNKNAHHFAHYSADCGKGYETALHMLANDSAISSSFFLSFEHKTISKPQN